MPQEVRNLGAIRPGRYLTRDGKQVYIACRSNRTQDNAPNAYMWVVEDGKTVWTVDEAGRHMKAPSLFDIVVRVSSA